MAMLRARECRAFIDAVVDQAEEMRVPVAIAVVNAVGYLMTFEANGRCRLHHRPDRLGKGVYGRRLPRYEPAVSRRAGHPTVVQGA